VVATVLLTVGGTMEGQRAGRNVSETVGINEAESSFQDLTGCGVELEGRKHQSYTVHQGDLDGAAEQC
jgi:hypothetical protein